MNIKLQTLTLNNFKGMKSLSVDFTQETDVFGDNGTGKTTLFDAFTWLLFGKDSHDATDFNIKTLDENNEPIHRVNHSVEGYLLIDGVGTQLSRVYSEKWTKPRGAAEEVFSGHETQFFWNNVPLNQKEYKEKIEGICPEGLFKLITNPKYFPSQNWKVQRETLFAMVSIRSDAELAKSNGDFVELFNSLNGKSMDEYKKEIAAKKKRIKEEMDTIPPRIDEVQRSIPEFNPELEKEVAELRKRLTETNAVLENVAERNKKAFEEKAKVQKLIHEKQEEQQSIHHEAKMKANEHAMKMEENRSEAYAEMEKQRIIMQNVKSMVDTLKEELEKANQQRTELVNRFEQKRAEKLSLTDEELVCPTCKRPYEDAEEKREQIVADFNSKKAIALDDMNEKGMILKEHIEDLKTRLGEHDERLSVEKDKLKKATELYESLPVAKTKDIDPNTIPEWVELGKEIERLSNYEVKEEKSEDLKALKAETESKLEELSGKIAIQNEIPKKQARIKELEEKNRKMAQEIAELEGIEFQMQEFTKFKINSIESAVNSLFPTVRFKLFDIQVNGQEVETCTAMINGVPYSDLNSAAKIWAGVEIINAISQHNNTYAPIFIDNRESTNRIPETESQVINLVVTKDKKLKIVAKEEKLQELKQTA